MSDSTRQSPSGKAPSKLLLLSVLCAAAGVLLIKLHIDRETERAWGGPPLEVLALTEDLPAGETLREDHLAVADRPERYVETRHVPRGRLEAVLGLSLGTPVKAGETLMWGDLAGMRTEPRQLSALVPEGTRAVPVSIDQEAFSELVRPGDRVDVLSSAEDTAHGQSRTLLQNLLVLAVGVETGGPGDALGGQAGQVTLNVTPEQAETLAQAQLTGTLGIALRNQADTLIHRGLHAR